MGLLAVDQGKCKRDGICMQACPMTIIEFKAKEAFPTLIEGGEEFCIRCGHCVAVCPRSAMSHEAMKPNECPPVREDWLLTPEQAAHFLRSRRSIRTYRKEKVERGLLLRLIDVARFAPSGHNFQPVKWRVIYDGNEARRLAGFVIDWMRHLIKERSPLAETLHLDRTIALWETGIDRILRDAPHVIVAHAPKEERTAPVACAIALAYLELAAPSFGLGACWAGYFNAAANFWPAMQKALELPDGEVSFGAMMVGYPKFKYHRLPLRKEAQVTWR